MGGCPRCGGLVVVEPRERRFVERMCLSCGHRAYQELPRNGHRGRREAQEALDLPAVPFKAHAFWLRRYKDTFPTWQGFKAHLESQGYVLERPLEPFGAELRPGPLVAVRGGGS